MLFDIHTIAPAASRSSAEFVGGAPWMRSSISKTVDDSAPEDEHGHEPDREHPELP